MKIPFIKIEGLGNDYIYVERKAVSRRGLNLPALSRRMSDRRRGVGADGLIVMEYLGAGRAFMAIFNSDGSEAEFCGNGLRGTSLYLKSVVNARGNRFTISTRWDDYQVRVMSYDGRNAIVRAMLGAPSFDPKAIGLKGRGRSCLGVAVETEEAKRLLYCVAMPNPHAVIFVDNFDFNWQKEGLALERSPFFRNRINIMFTRVDSKKRITIRPWERGSGATSACGSGAAAATVIASLLEYTTGDVTAVMPGGSLKTRWDIEENMVYQEGPTRIAFSGSFIG